MRYVVLIGLLFTLTLTGAAFGSVITCPNDGATTDDWVLTKWLGAKAVFAGKVISVEIPDPPKQPDSGDAKSMKELLDRIEAAQSNPSLSAHYFQTASIEVEESWKGALGVVVSVRVPLRQGTYFREGESYLVFAHGIDGSRVLEVSPACGDLATKDSSTKAMGILDDLTK